MFCSRSGEIRLHAVTAGLSTSNRLAGSCRFATSPSKARRLRQLAARSTTMTANTGQTAEAWKHQAPYLHPKDEEDFKVQHKANCMCGEIQYVVDSDPVAAKFCHCTSCQILHGMSAASAQTAANMLDST